MIIQSSNLALRFYKRNGWTSQLMKTIILPEYRKQYNELVRDTTESHGDPEYWAYFAFNPGCEYTVNVKLLLELKTELIRAFDDYPKETDEEFIRRHL